MNRFILTNGCKFQEGKAQGGIREYFPAPK